MFDQLFEKTSVVADHVNAPYAEERMRYLSYCARRGDSRSTLLLKARELLWVARKLSAYPDLRVTIQQIRVAADDWQERERACGHKLNKRWTTRRFIDVASTWLRYLGCLCRPMEPIPFEPQLKEYCIWARDERGLSETTIGLRHSCVKQFLRWYGVLERPLSDVHINDVDTYLSHVGDQGWCRDSIENVAMSLRAFFRYGAERGWASRQVASVVQGPRIYALERLPKGPAWEDVQQLFSSRHTKHPKKIRDHAILMLFAIYGLRESEVAKLRLDDLDWEHDLLHVSRAKRRETQIYPLLPSVGNAIIRYLEKVRQSSTHREVFLTLLSPFRPLSRSALYSIVSCRLKILGVRTAHYGPHSLRHACAGHLVADGFSLKEIGDHLGHRSSAATRIYAKVDLPGLREVAAFDLGGLL
jgi:integrase/recombinase XerD